MNEALVKRPRCDRLFGKHSGAAIYRSHAAVVVRQLIARPIKSVRRSVRRSAGFSQSIAPSKVDRSLRRHRFHLLEWFRRFGSIAHSRASSATHTFEITKRMNFEGVVK